MNNKICNIASEIHLTPTETIVYLQDYILNCEEIESISAPQGIEVWSNRADSKLKLVITENDIVLPVSNLDITFKDGSTESIVLIKSKKVKYVVRFYPQGYVNSVQIAGDFNSWNPKGFDFQYIDNCWQYTLEIEPGNYSYQLIVDGNWINDPCNNEVLENGYGGYNSLLRVPFANSEKMALETVQVLDNNVILSASDSISGYLALWQNTVINDTNSFRQRNRLVITIPEDAKKMQRSYIRVYGYNTTTMTNDLFIPLEYGKVLESADKITRNDKEAQTIYFALIDRFNNSGTKKNVPFEQVHAKLNFHGGDLKGIQQKIEDGYFKQLGINTIWISPVVKNPNTPIEKNDRKSAGYHGYWPLISDKIDEHFGTEQDFHNLINSAHKHGINIILDYVANHVFKDNQIIKDQPNWSTPLYLPDGSKNIGRWEDQRFSTWFEEFLPTLDFSKPAVVEKMTDIAVEWIEKYNLDGFRHDATKHIQTEFWRKLTKKLKERIVIPQQKRLFQIGETFGGREMLQSYVNSGIHDSQFSFNLYYETRSAFLYEEVHFEKLCICLRQEMEFFGSHHLMGNISGNHDLPRFISYAGEDLWTNQNAEHEGWNRYITVKNPIGYKKLAMLLAFNATIPGIPVIYYGDEIGIPGGGDPDNRRPMYFSGLNEYEQENLAITQKLGQLRNGFLPFIYGDFSFLQIEQKLLVYKRNYFEEFAIVYFNKTNETKTIEVKLTHSVDYNDLQSFSQCKYYLRNLQLFIEIPAMTFEIIYRKKPAKQNQTVSMSQYEQFLN
ncbi:MAG: alpha-amylase family glycosyl hydrolase [Bacteroidales bacterium]|nr:alpha-amylase family glycosyl hydrolase [Bacteroidales bacterium]